MILDSVLLKKMCDHVIDKYCTWMNTHNTHYLKIDKNYATHPELHDVEFFGDSQKEACKHYFLIEIEKSSITEEDKVLLIANIDEMFLSNYHLLTEIGLLVSNMCYNKDVSLASYILDGYINFIKATVRYRETFVEDAKKLYQAQQSNQKH